MFPSGNVGIITKQRFETLFAADSYKYIAVKSDGAAETAAALRGLGFEAATIAQMQLRAKQVNADMFTVLNYIVVLSTIAGVFGVLNNLLIAFNSQKRERALLRSIGMSKSKNKATTVIQASTAGLVGGVLGLAGGMLFSSTVPALLVVFEFPAQAAPLSPIAAALCIVCSAAVCVFASLLSLVGKSKTNIVQTLREEIL
jgi:ABC-type antimicrobial peptide transport system permease subunit